MNSKDIRKLRQILKDPVAREDFVGEGGSIDSAMQKLGPVPTKRGQGLLGDIEALTETLKRYPWTTLTTLKGDAQVVRKLDEAEKLLRELRKTLTK